MLGDISTADMLGSRALLIKQAAFSSNELSEPCRAQLWFRRRRNEEEGERMRSEGDKDIERHLRQTKTKEHNHI